MAVRQSRKHTTHLPISENPPRNTGIGQLLPGARGNLIYKSRLEIMRNIIPGQRTIPAEHRSPVPVNRSGPPVLVGEVDGLRECISSSKKQPVAGLVIEGSLQSV